MARPKKTNAPPELSPLELAIMQIIWDLGECHSRQVIEAYNARHVPQLADTSIRTVLANLRKKGFLEPIPSLERGFGLRPLINREAVARRSITSLVTGLFNGSPRQMISWLIKDEALDETEIEAIRRIIADHQKGKKS